MSFFRELARWSPPAQEVQEIERFGDPGFQSWVDAMFKFQSQLYTPSYVTTIPGSKTEAVMDSFIGYVQGVYKRNGVVFAVSQARSRLFTDATFKWRRLGQTGGGSDLFGNPDLAVLETPWPGGTTQNLLARAEQDVTTAGTFFVVREGDRLRRLRPDWCEFILSAPPDIAVQSDILGIKYTVGGLGGGGQVELYPVNPPQGMDPDGFAAFWAPIPDPAAMYRGMSWMSPVLEEMRSDQAATDHKLKFFENAATPNLAISLKDTVTVEQFQEFVRMSREASAGTQNAYKTMYLGGGADVTPIGSTLQQMDFSTVQGHGETRICAAGGVPPIIVGLSEGLNAATYSNYAQARRAFGDAWARPQWKSFAGAIQPIIVVPSNAQLWVDTRDVAFLREDSKDLAEVQATTASTINALLAAGWTPESALEAVLAEDLSKLVHSGLMSVQLQPPGAQDKGPTDADQAQVFATQVGALVQLSAGPFDPESAVAATEAGDLGELVYVEPEPVPDPLADPAAEDPNAPLTDDAAVRYSVGMDATRHLPGQHNQQAHANRIGKPTNVPGKTGLSKIAGELKAAPDQGPALPPKNRKLSNQDIRDALVGPDAPFHASASKKTEDHRQALMDAGASREHADEILKDLGANPDRDYETFDAGYVTHRRVETEKENTAARERKAKLAEATPAAYAQLLGTDDHEALVKSKPVAQVFEAMKAAGWTITSVTGHGGYTFQSPDESRTIQVLAINGVKIYDERHNSISGVKALNYVRGAT